MAFIVGLLTGIVLRFASGFLVVYVPPRPGSVTLFLVLHGMFVLSVVVGFVLLFMMEKPAGVLARFASWKCGVMVLGCLIGSYAPLIGGAP